MTLINNTGGACTTISDNFSNFSKVHGLSTAKRLALSHSSAIHHIQDGFHFSVFAGETGQDSVSESPEPETSKSNS